MTETTDNTPFSKEELQRRMRNSYDAFSAYIAGLSDAQMTVPTDAAGWTVKDHLAHLAVWTDGITAALNHQSRREAMGVDQALWDQENHDYFDINEQIRGQHVNKPLSQVKDEFRTAHERIVAKIETMEESDLLRPYVVYQPGAVNEPEPVWAYIIGNSYGYYEEHQPWIAAIVQGK